MESNRIKPPLRNHTHCQVARKDHLTSQNLAKSMAAPTLTEKKAQAYNNVSYVIGQLVVN